MYHVPLAFQFIYERSDGGEKGDRRRVEIITSPLVASRMCVRSLKVNAGKSKVMVLNRKEGL